MKALLLVVSLLALGMSLSGCVLVAAAGAGYFVGDEITEGDGRVDPLERALGYENESN